MNSKTLYDCGTWKIMHVDMSRPNQYGYASGIIVTPANRPANTHIPNTITIARWNTCKPNTSQFQTAWHNANVMLRRVAKAELFALLK
jgi:hypothetical protein